MAKCPNCNNDLKESTFFFTGKGLVYECEKCLKVVPPIQCRFDPCELIERCVDGEFKDV